MANITSVQDGDWNTATTWDSGSVPTNSDDVVIMNTVTIGANASARSIIIIDGSLITSPLWAMNLKATLECGRFTLHRRINDTRAVRLDGITLNLTTPSITCSGSGDGIQSTSYLYNNPGKIIIDDPGAMGFTAQMQDIKPEGCARAYARKVSNGVRYMTITVHIKADRCDYIGQLYRMAENPYQVLAATYSGVLKGFIEAITPVDSVGKEYRSFRVSIAEGPSQ